jgi:hypothetical protein
MVVLENVCGKFWAWDSEMWFASLDLQKAFDRIENDSLFPALQALGVPDTYLQVLRRLYANQSGNDGGNRFVFNIPRGVKQGDVLSPMLFNFGLEHAMRNWKQFLKSHGLHVDSSSKLTNNQIYVMRSFVIRKDVEGIGGDVGITGCGTQPRSLAFDYFQGKIAHNLQFGTSFIH